MSSVPSTFHIFPNFPVEIRVQIWHAAILPHIVRWIRKSDDGNSSSNIFNSSTHVLPLFQACRESREAALLYGKYVLLSRSPRAVWFSPVFDYLFLDPRWTKLTRVGLAEGVLKDPLDSLPFNLKDVRKIMIHPNYTDNRLRPGIPLERMISLDTILITADEKSIGVNSEFMQASVYDLKKYYEAIKRKRTSSKMPHIAVGCLGWVGEERNRLNHGEEDHRELVAVFEGSAEMKLHLHNMREEELRFLQETFNKRKPGLILRFRPGKTVENLVSVPTLPTPQEEQSDDQSNSGEGTSRSETKPEEPPTYLHAVSGVDILLAVN